MKRCFLVFIFLLFSSSLFSGELNNLNFIQTYNSSTFINGSKAALVNPAGLYSLNNLNIEFNSYNLGISYLGMAFPTAEVLGNLSFGVYSFNTSGGAFVSIGNNLWNVLGIGFTLKTLSSSVFSPFDAFLFDTGLIFHPNASLGLDFLKNEFLNDKFFISFAVKNIGSQPRTTEGENLSLRLGGGYDLAILGTKIFIEKSFLADRDIFILGGEFSPILAFISDKRIFSIGATYDFEQRETKIYGGILLDEVSINLSYSVNNRFFFLGMSGYFGKRKDEMSMEYYSKALDNYQNAQKIEKTDIEEAFNLYQLAYKDLNKAINLDSDNKKAAILKDSIEEKIENYKNNFKTEAEKNENNKNYLLALSYYKKLYSIDKNKDIKNKIDTLSTNNAVLKSIEKEKAELIKLHKNKKYVEAKKKADYLVEVIPDDIEIRNIKSEIESTLEEVAKKYYNIASTEYKKGNLTGCLDNLRKALYYKPNYTKARDLYNLTITEISKKRGLDKAKEEFAKGNNIMALKLVDAYLENNPDNKEAIALKNSITQKLKSEAQSILDRGIAYYNNGEYEKSVEELDKVLLIDNTNSIARDYKTRALSKLKALKKLESIEEE
ncbi:MAG: hypothetical protein N2258_00425 [Brevinematales bacterium]|nr:hypothetical protein [Brevinematales bacterium]